MLALQKGDKKGKCTPNVLPCRINHNGPINLSKRYWDPIKEQDQPTTAHFRGKKLYGKQLRVPHGYRGVVALKTEKALSAGVGAGVEDEGVKSEIQILQEQSEFDDIMVWGHEVLPDETTDQFVLGIDEWIPFSQQIHSYEDRQENSSKETPII
ncbi:hypothetical protein K3495_g7901 [Podosphaera aphanis]|nr:hypothetical protein K3495_g7901 [Podosphaera aphanis]